MKILEINVMRGPNYWSIKRQKLIVMKLDLEELEERPTNLISGFAERLESLLPSLYEHRCSEGYPGGFFFRVREGTWMGHVVEHIAIEIQTLAGMKCSFGQTRDTGEHGVYFVVFEYKDEDAGLYAAKAAVDIARALITGEHYDVPAAINAMRQLEQKNALGPSTGAIVTEAQKRGIPFKRLNNESLVQLGYGTKQKTIQAAMASSTSALAVEIAGDKDLTKLLLKRAGIPVPHGVTIKSAEELVTAAEGLGFPLVIKPLDGNQGKGATINIQSLEEAKDAFTRAQAISPSVIVERYISGYDYRLLVVNNKFVAAAKRTPAAVTGDGKSTIHELIQQVNQDPRRGGGHENVLTAIKIEETTLGILKSAGLTLGSVLKENEVLHLKTTANLSTGGTAEDATDLVHPENKKIAERIARTIGLDICGIDVISSDISIPLHESGGAVLEVNASPGLRMHLAPSEGISRDIAEPIVDMLFPNYSNGRIPIIAVTGTNGKTTTTRLIAHMVKTAGYNVGMTTTDGIYIQDDIIEKGDCTGPLSTEQVLADQSVNFAVLECARGGILRSGLGFSFCDVGVVTNVGTDHLGLKGIDTIEKMAKVKGVVPESVEKDGFAILNADDDLVYQMRNNVSCKVAYFSMNPDSDRIWLHTLEGGIAAVLEDGYVTLIDTMKRIKIEAVKNIPLSFDGKAECMVQNILAATLAAYVKNIKLKDIQKALVTFVPSPSTTPGRMNMFTFRNFKVMIDYAHNQDGFKAMGQFLSKLDIAPKVGIITGVGDRRDDDLKDLGRIAADIFDEIIIRLDKDLRDREESDIINLLVQGIKQSNSNVPFRIIKDEVAAIDFALMNAIPGSFITILCESVNRATETVKAHLEKESIAPLPKKDLVRMTSGYH